MAVVRLTIAYDGAPFAGWAAQPGLRTVQGEVEAALQRILGTPVSLTVAGRTDAGVHARGQSVGVRVPPRWEPRDLRRALNAVLPRDVWVAAAAEMRPEFHARYDATARRYSYYVGTDDGAHSPFRRRWEWAVGRPLARGELDASARALLGEHCFLAFAVRGTAPADDHHRCIVHEAAWRDRPGGLVFGERPDGVVLDVPEHARQDAPKGPCRRARPVEANNFGHQVEAPQDGMTYVAGGDGVVPAALQRGKEVEARIAGDRVRIDRQPRSSRIIGRGREDVPPGAEVPVQEAIPWFGEDLAQRSRASDEQRALQIRQGPP
jgi:tRNA pseudouridine38-40 synthase